MVRKKSDKLLNSKSVAAAPREKKFLEKTPRKEILGKSLKKTQQNKTFSELDF